MKASLAIVGNVRVQALSETLVRIEEKGQKGFEDRATFMVMNREWSGADCQVQQRGASTILTTQRYQVVILDDGSSLNGVRVESLDGELLYRYDGDMPPMSNLPAPGDVVKAWAMADGPRIIPPQWGATPPPPEFQDDPHSGWEVDNNAPDVYVFMPGDGGYRQLCQDFLKLTGPIPMPPLYAFGLIDSRYHPYTEASALETIDTYRRKNIPLDVFVVDTDWRVGASHGYQINRELFPDMQRFIRRAHERHVMLMYNDHPEPVSENGLDAKELQYRWAGLAKLLELGIDVWWYDRNWMVQIKSPVKGLHRDMWGMRLYHDITQRFRPRHRPLIMSNVAQIANGIRKGPASPAEHRYPVWWTGDTRAQWDYLRRGIANGVDYGVIALMPYVNEDLGGHIGAPSDELYVRFVQYGALSPITRLHCTAGQSRYPWAFGPEAEEIVAEYIRLRYRLLPMIYAAARQAYEDGTPLLRRCDLYWPEYPEAHDSSQYLFGEDVLVAPVVTGATDFAAIAEAHLQTPDGKPGITGEYFANRGLKGKPAYTRTDAAINFGWGKRGAPEGLSAAGFSIRWRGRLANIPESGEYVLGALVSGQVRVWLEGKLVINHNEDDAPTPILVSIVLEKDMTYALRVEFGKSFQRAMVSLTWLLPSRRTSLPTRSLWIPPGAWQEVWTGRTLAGPQTVPVSSELWHTPMAVREGGLVLSIPQMQYTGQQPWPTVIVDAFVPGENRSTTRFLYEDDGGSPAYQAGAYCRTPVSLERNGENIACAIGEMAGDFEGKLGERSWVIRLHLPKGARPRTIKLNGSETSGALIAPAETERNMPFSGQGAPPGPDAGDVLEVLVAAQSTDTKIKLDVQI